jgi:hypothetical protein
MRWDTREQGVVNSVLSNHGNFRNFELTLGSTLVTDTQPLRTTPMNAN